MPGLQSDCTVAAAASPLKKSRLSLKFFQKKETKRALDFSDALVEEQKTTEPEGPDIPKNDCDQVVPDPHQPPTLPCERRENLMPFVGLNNLGNTCYLNSVLQVLYYCPGFKDGIKKLYNLLSKMKETLKNDAVKSELQGVEADLPVNMELLGSFHNLILSVEQLQSSFLLNPEKHGDGDLATPPRRLLNVLRQLNPMYEGYLQHDAQEVLQCILGYIQEACETIKEEHKSDVSAEQPQATEEQPRDTDEQPQHLQAEGATEPETTTPEVTGGTAESQLKDPEQEENLEGQVNGKRKSDTEAGNAKKKSKTKKCTENPGYLTQSKRKSSSGISVESPTEDVKVKEEKEEEEEEKSNLEGKGDGTPEGPNKKKRRSRLSWLKPSGKQPSIFSKFRSMGRISAHVGAKVEAGPEEERVALLSCKAEEAPAQPVQKATEKKREDKEEDAHSLDLMERMFQGQLVLRTRCLECERYTERREDFQNISVPVQEDGPHSPYCSPEISPDPKLEPKTLKWAISQFASVERIVGQDKYFCETCHHYTEAERSLLFDKTPEVVTIHLKCFAASSSEIDPYAGLSKVNTPLQTPLRLSLEEWGTRPCKEHYELFAVVMHSGVTISSGHYTAFIKMMDLKEVQLTQREEQEEARPYGPQQEFDDGEVSFNLGSKPNHATPAKAGSKKGLLGGQRSVSSFELGTGKQANPEKTSSTAADSGKSERTGSGGEEGTVQKSGEEGAVQKSGEEGAVQKSGEEGAVQKSGEEGAVRKSGEEGAVQKSGEEGAVQKSGNAAEEGCVASEGTSSAPAPGSLLDYEGKWMLFDDSEVRLFDEKDFLTACSPETSTTSTPYLLFYKKVCQE
ncbi:ubiquitin carboxyl-terminal hydrolase 1 [Conger conger]|uniref:ubiquitin carboxyl-terminal hydrolase 1 n=1 Tax=Conger conger TaxID=82655 RepID=UPI002A59E195|nr:ubiquitin carboxyl-terminal hydrolase 1 [Conger conger]